MEADVERWRREFPIVDECVFLNHAAMSPISQRVARAVMQQVAQHALYGPLRTAQWERRYAEVREGVARLVNGRSSHIAFIQNTSDGISLVANGFTWQPGDNVVLPEVEFPSNYYAWAGLVAQGVGLNKVRVGTNGRSNIQASETDYMTNVEGIFAAGDGRRGQSLVVWAIREGRGAARECDRWLMGETDLP